MSLRGKKSFLLLGLILLLINISFSSAALTDGLVGHWTFDEGSGTSAADSSGNGNTGTLVNGPTWVAGKVGSGALGFDGVNDYIRAPPNIIGIGAITTCAWVNQRPTGIRFESIVDNQRFVLQTDNFNSPNFELRLNSDGGSNTAVSASYNGSNVWVHACVSRNASGAANFYVNGTASGTANQNSGTPTNLGYSTGIGVYGSLDAYFFNGSLDEVRIYNRVLSAAEIQQLYQLGESSPSQPVQNASNNSGIASNATNATMQGNVSVNVSMNATIF